MDQAQNLRSRVKLQNMPEHLARVMTVTSGKGGVGKSNMSVNLAICLSRLGKRVIVLDVDFGLANVEIMLGIRPKYTLADLMFQGKSLSDVITDGPEGIGFISGGSGIQEMNNLSREQLTNLSARLVELDEMADIILIDTGAGVSDSVMEFVMASSEILLVVTPEPTSITDSYALLKALSRKPEFVAGRMNIKLIVNRVQSAQEGMELLQKLNVVVEKYLNMSMEYLGAVPQDKYLLQAVMKQKPVTIQYPSSPASKAVMTLADNLLEREGHKSAKEKKHGIVSMFMTVVGRNHKR